MYNSKELTAQGYRRISNRFRIISRIDHPDWKEYMAREHAPWDIEEGMQWVLNFRPGEAEDWYRRCLSKDILKNIPEEIYQEIPGSGHDPIGYVSLKPI